MKRKVIDIYREALQRAQDLRERDNGLDDEKASELFYFCAELENTEEVNPSSSHSKNKTAKNNQSPDRSKSVKEYSDAQYWVLNEKKEVGNMTNDNLSDKIVEGFYCEGDIETHILVEDVREAVKKLKEKMDTRWDSMIIDEIFGEDLI